jgi:hypothetical protein
MIATATAIIVSLVTVLSPKPASAASCTAPSTDYGTISLNVSVPASGSYRVWTRMAAPDTTNNTYLLEIDGNTCYTVGGSSVPVYAGGATTYFVNNNSNWIARNTGGSYIDQNFSAGTHSLKLIGNGDGVVLDRLIFTQDINCTPTGTGDNCANPTDTTKPVVIITSPASNATLTKVTNIAASATDDVAVTKVEFYVDGNLRGTQASPSSGSTYTYSLNFTGLAAGSHTLTAKAYDAADNFATSTAVVVTISFRSADINQDGVINYSDLSALAGKYGQSGAGLGRADINGDGTVNYLDLSILASNYNT